MRRLHLLLLAVLACALVIVPSAQASRLKAKAVAQDKAAVQQYWTKQRMANARPAGRILSGTFAPAAKPVKKPAAAVQIPPPYTSQPTSTNGKVFFTSAYGTGGALLGLRATGQDVSAQEIYFTRNMQNHHGGVVLVDGYLYGFNNSILTCLEFETGKVMWRDRSVGKGSVAYADGHLYVLSEDNVVGLVEASPKGYRETGRFSIADQGWPSWAHPVISGGRLFVRNQNVLASYDVRAK